ncbi:SDR family NAD(P)-dependent oxidoreductase [Nonomuraea sp. NPDC050404]|uniref:SDR family NAD(P)-dependent oxidoreductase n=1 Tax=Nonomuraea sp. NPDC050404 TaxID=3155783 RepID=UPI0033CA3BBE
MNRSALLSSRSRACSNAANLTGNRTIAGHWMVLIGRDPDRAATLARELPAATVITTDVATGAGAARAAEQVAATIDQIDTLINNAGVMVPERRVTTEGMD